MELKSGFSWYVAVETPNYIYGSVPQPASTQTSVKEEEIEHQALLTGKNNTFLF